MTKRAYIPKKISPTRVVGNPNLVLEQLPETQEQEEMPLGFMLEPETFGSGLSAKQIAFANLLLEGKDITEAFKESYQWSVKNKSLIPGKAKAAFLRPELQKYLQNQILIRAQPGYGKQLIDRTEWLKTIKSLADEARDEKKYSAAISALELYGKAEKWLGDQTTTGDTLETAMWIRWIERGLREIEDAPGHIQEVIKDRGIRLLAPLETEA